MYIYLQWKNQDSKKLSCVFKKVFDSWRIFRTPWFDSIINSNKFFSSPEKSMVDICHLFGWTVVDTTSKCWPNVVILLSVLFLFVVPANFQVHSQQRTEVSAEEVFCHVLPYFCCILADWLIQMLCFLSKLFASDLKLQ